MKIVFNAIKANIVVIKIYLSNPLLLYFTSAQIAVKNIFVFKNIH